MFYISNISEIGLQLWLAHHIYLVVGCDSVDGLCIIWLLFIRYLLFYFPSNNPCVTSECCTIYCQYHFGEQPLAMNIRSYSHVLMQQIGYL